MPIGKKEIFITFRVEKSNYFKRDGSDIHTDAEISIAQAILGGATRIQGIYENLTVDVPSGTSSHMRLRLKGKGLRKLNGLGSGDHYVHVKVKIPTKLSTQQEVLMRAYAELESDTPGTINGVVTTKGGSGSTESSTDSSKTKSESSSKCEKESDQEKTGILNRIKKPFLINFFKNMDLIVYALKLKNIFKNITTDSLNK